jgi:chemotaxis protein methyltransferase CheR
VAQLKPDPFGPLAVQVVEALIVHETSWFRDGHPFQTLGATLLPKLIEARKQERSINIWSAACSTSQEPYSIAMLMQECFPVLDG